MLRFYISTVTGGGLTMDDAVRPVLHDVLRSAPRANGTAASHHIMADKSFALVACDVDNATHTALVADPGVFPLPARDLTVDQLTLQQLTALQAKLVAIGVAFVPGELVRNLIIRIGRKINQQFLIQHAIPNGETNTA